MGSMVKWVAACSIAVATGTFAQGGVRVASGDVDGDGRAERNGPPKDVKPKADGRAAGVAVQGPVQNAPRPAAPGAESGEGKPRVMLTPLARPGTPPPAPAGNLKGPASGPPPNATNFGVLLGGGGEAQAPKPAPKDAQAKPAAPAPALLLPAVQKAR